MPWSAAVGAVVGAVANKALAGGGSATGYAMNPKINGYADQQAQLGTDAMSWLKQNYADTQGLRDNASATALGQSAQDQGLSSQQAGLSASTAGVLTSKINPVISNLADTAMNYDTTARRESAAAQAGADVDTQLTAERQAQARAAMARGVDPTSGNFVAGDSQLGATGAAAKAAAMNQARLNVENTGINLKSSVAGLGVNLGNLQNSQTASALDTGNSAITAATQPLNINQNGANLMTSAYGIGMDGVSNAGNLLNGQATNATKAAMAQDQMNNANMNGLGGALGNLAATKLLQSGGSNNTPTNNIPTSGGGSNGFGDN